jgi:hypothetical protein
MIACLLRQVLPYFSSIQGFPDFAPPQHVIDALADVSKSDNVLLQPYTRGYVGTSYSHIYYEFESTNYFI